MKTRFGKNDEAVSPVIGVILMVAITVILAAVIAAFVFGMGPQKQAPQASIRAENPDIAAGTVVIEHQGGAELNLGGTKLVAEYTDSAGAVYRLTEPVMDTATPPNKFTPGDKIRIVLSTGVGTLNFDSGTGGTPLTPDTTTVSSIPATLTSGGKIQVSLIDIPTGQMVAQSTVNT